VFIVVIDLLTDAKCAIVTLNYNWSPLVTRDLPRSWTELILGIEQLRHVWIWTAFLLVMFALSVTWLVFFSYIQRSPRLGWKKQLTHLEGVEQISVLLLRIR